MKLLIRVIPALLCLSFTACSDNEPPVPEGSQTVYPDNTVSDNDSRIEIRDDNTTSTGATFRPDDEYSFWIDGLKYSMTWTDLTITDSDPKLVAGDVKPWATVVYKDRTYTTVAVGPAAFRQCKEMTSCSLPVGVTSIENGDLLGAFDGCSGLKAVFSPKGLKRIGHEAFKGCEALEIAYLPDGLESIGYNSFEGCTSLKSVKFPESIRSVCYYAFSHCTSIRTVRLPLNAHLADGVFAGCSLLKSVEIPYGISYIPSYFFTNCVALESVELPEGIVYIGLNAFSGCELIESITLPEGLMTVFENAFSGCVKLKSVTAGDVLGFRNYAFSGCRSLKTFISNVNTPPYIDTQTFVGLPSDATLYVPAEAVQTYKASNWGSAFANILSLN